MGRAQAQPGRGLTAAPSPGLTALHVAVNTGCQEAVQLLLERGADIDAVVSGRAGAGAGPAEGAGPRRVRESQEAGPQEGMLGACGRS